MTANKWRFTLLLLLTALVLAAPLLAQRSADFDLNWHVLSGGGGPRASAVFQIDDVLGQWPDGRSSSARFQIDPGFWHAGRLPEDRRSYLPVTIR